MRGPITHILLVLTIATGPSCIEVNHPPLFGPLPPLSVTVGETLRFTLTAKDPDGDAVTFRVVGAPQGARIEGSDFVYSPLASDAGPSGQVYNLTFYAEDGRGGRTEAATSLHVLPEASIPRFLGPFAWALNLGVEDHIAAVIAVRDDDSPSVTLRAYGLMDGAKFVQDSSHSASFYFKPREDQVEAGAVFSFVVGASDGDHPEVFADFAVVLVNADLFGGCPGSPPLATHVPLQDQRANGPYPLVVRASDSDSKVREVLAFWAPTGGLAEADMNQVSLAPTGNGTFEGHLPDLGAAAGSGHLIYYHIKVFDNDDPTSDTCDHVLRLPKKGEFAFAVYDVNAEAPCLEDAFMGNPAPLPTGEVSGLRLCDGKADVFLVDLMEGEGVAAKAAPMSGAGPLTIRIFDPSGLEVAHSTSHASATASVSGTYRLEVIPPDTEAVTYALQARVLQTPCMSDPFEDDGPAPLGPGEVQARLCPADEDLYEFSLGKGDVANLTLHFEPKEADLDIALYDKNTKELLKVSEGKGSEERIIFEASKGTSLLLRVYAWTLLPASYTLKLEVLGQGTECEDDLLAPSNSPENAPILFEGLWEHLKLCPGESDYFATGLNGGEEIFAAIQAEGPAPPLSILWHDGKEVLAQGEVSEDMAMVEAVAPGPGTYFFRVGPGGGEVVSYDLYFSAKDPEGPCTPDRFEPNDDLEKAASIPQGFTTHLTLCPGDVDLFAFKAPAYAALWGYVLYGSTTPRLSLTDSKGGHLAEATPSDYGQELFYLIRESGTYVFRVEGAGKTGFYDFGWWLE